MKRTACIFVLTTAVAIHASDGPGHLVWPPAPDSARVAFLKTINCEQLRPHSGFLGKLARFIGGNSDDEQLTYPFDVVAGEKSLYMVFQNVAALVEIDRDKMTYKLHRCDKNPFVYPVSLCRSGRVIFITDPEASAVYRFADGKVSRFISEDLIRPTGIAALPSQNRLYVIDTGDHRLKIFDLEGRLLRVVPDEHDSTSFLHYPTFAASTDDEVLVNDGLNYRIRRFDHQGKQLFAFGKEGNGPGSLARPKGLAIDSDGNIYVVDNIFDNVQIFDAKGRLLLVVGTSGQEPGQFWSPAGIDIDNDTIYVADVFNNRVQIMQYLGGER